MANLFLDSFDHYATAELTQKWTSISSATISAGNGRRASQSLRVGAGGYASKTFGSANATFICGFSANFSAFPGAQGAVVRLYDSGVVQHFTLNITAAGLFQAMRGTTAGTLLGTSSSGVSVGVTAYIELKVTIDDAAGVVQLRVNGTTVLNLSGVDTRNAGVASWVQVDLTNPTGNADYDDLYIHDGSGAVNNGFWGDTRVEPHYPTANGNTSGSTPSTGTDRSATTDELLTNGDTDYNTVIAVNEKDTLVVQDLKAVGATIKTVQTVHNTKKTDAGVATHCPVVRHSGTDYDGTSVSPATAYSMFEQIYETNPGTGAAWTESNFNAAEFGYKRLT